MELILHIQPDRARVLKGELTYHAFLQNEMFSAISMAIPEHDPLRASFLISISVHRLQNQFEISFNHQVHDNVLRVYAVNRQVDYRETVYRKLVTAVALIVGNIVDHGQIIIPLENRDINLNDLNQQ